MKDYRITLRVQNNYFYQAMQAAGFKTAAQLSRETGVTQAEIGKYLNLRLIPFDRQGEYRPGILKISAALNAMVLDLFPEDQLYNPLDKNTHTIEMSKEQAQRLTNQPSPVDYLIEHDLNDGLQEALSTIAPREARILGRYFGVNSESHTLEELAKEEGVTRERIRQIVAKALRKLRNPERAGYNKLKQAHENMEGYQTSRPYNMNSKRKNEKDWKSEEVARIERESRDMKREVDEFGEIFNVGNMPDEEYLPPGWRHKMSKSTTT